jgi:hypothetical protein
MSLIRIGIICRTHIRLELREVGGDPLEDVVDTDRNYNDDMYQDFYYMRIRIMSFPYVNDLFVYNFPKKIRKTCCYCVQREGGEDRRCRKSAKL